MLWWILVPEILFLGARHSLAVCGGGRNLCRLLVVGPFAGNKNR